MKLLPYITMCDITPQYMQHLEVLLQRKFWHRELVLITSYYEVATLYV